MTRTLLCVTLYLACAVNAENITGRVVGIVEGDSITALEGETLSHKIRFAGTHAPESDLNRDVTEATLAQTICVSGYTKTIRPSMTYTNFVKKRLMVEQGLDYETSKADYELDHVIPLALGGHPRHLNNLMLQPWEGTDGAKRKDRLEVKLQCLDCAGDIPLAVAQDAIWTDWKVAYVSYGNMVCHRQRKLKSGDYGDQ
jgi:hypothetical protein